MISLLQEKYWQKNLLKLAIITLITIIVWVAAATYRSFTKSRIAPDVKKQLLPLTPTLDIDTMEKIQQRQVTPTINWNDLKPAKPEILALPKSATVSAKIASPSAGLE